MKLKRKDGSEFSAAVKLGNDYKITFAPFSHTKDRKNDRKRTNN